MSAWISPAQAAEAIERGDGHGVRIAVLDSGIEASHPIFSGRRLHDDVVTEADGHIRPGNGEDLYGHGTAVAGIIWQLAPKVEIGSFRVFGSSLSARTAQVSVAARKAISLGYRVLNCSFACGISGHLPIYKDWADSALLSGVHVVAASGSPEVSEWPAHLSSVLGVDCALTNRGGLRYLAGRMVEFAAPAAEVRVAWKQGGHRVMTGSSFAAAWLSGMLARLLSVYPGLDPLLAKSLLRRIAGEGMVGAEEASGTRRHFSQTT
ncbi:MAG: S8 family serine peptidase [Terrimicrobiaceae bacterium]